MGTSQIVAKTDSHVSILGPTTCNLHLKWGDFVGLSRLPRGSLLTTGS